MRNSYYTKDEAKSTYRVMQTNLYKIKEITLAEQIMRDRKLRNIRKCL